MKISNSTLISTNNKIIETKSSMYLSVPGVYTPIKLSLEEWRSISWKNTEKYIYKLQQRIYSASVDNNIKLGRKLQHTLIQYRHAKLLSLRKIPQENTGKKTAGINGILALRPKERFDLVRKLKVGSKATAVRRV